MSRIGSPLVRFAAEVKSVTTKKNEVAVQIIVKGWDVDKVADIAEFAGSDCHVTIESDQMVIDIETGELS